ncbi:MAG: sigma-70 family RNA polymerase sigma factor [Pseudonocardiaceae bacterium]
MQDREIHRRLVYGDENALGEVYDQHCRVVHAVALRVTRDTGMAEDVTQEVFVSLWERPLAFDPARGSLRGWLYLLAHRRAIDRVRTEARRRGLVTEPCLCEPMTPGAIAADPAEIVLASMTAASVRAALDDLPLPIRQAVELAYFRDRTYREVAAELGIPEGTAKSRLRSGLRRLAVALERERGDES